MITPSSFARGILERDTGVITELVSVSYYFNGFF